MNTNVCEVTSVSEAWKIANQLFPTDYILDAEKSNGAGYPIYVSTADGYNGWISDLNTRLELNFADGTSKNIWIVEKPKTRTMTASMKYELLFSVDNAISDALEFLVNECYNVTGHEMIIDRLDAVRGIVLMMQENEKQQMKKDRIA